ncbi:MAG: hypothetical protein H6751_07535 [Candidatus Omnitrophica bacterium]|nr:hypothetical protein [Candidatus Omnitrophota bacterium]MCB9782801.1 hypothetical protein [Candidatus Omnitrophota bacterium]
MRSYHTPIIVCSFLFFFTPSAFADYEIYKSDGFQKVHEIVEKKENEDGTFTVRAKKSKDSDQVVTIENVVEIKEVQAKSGPQYMEREKPTPTPAPTQVAPTTESRHSASADVPWVRKLSKTVVAAVIGIIAAFLILFMWVKSSN